MHDGQHIETVAIPEGDRLTFCVSSQAGCALRCAFCATGLMGFARNLEAHEIAGQVRELALLDPPLNATNIVFMGMGEPLLNWPAIDTVLTILNDPTGFGIGARHITVSTVGVLPGILALAARPEQFRLAISVHAPSDALRHTLMPINTKYPLADVIAAAAEFDRRVTFEYVMLGGVNDGPEQARDLAGVGASVPCVREPDSVAPGRGRQVHANQRRGHSSLRRMVAASGRRGGDSEEPRDGYCRRVRPATG